MESRVLISSRAWVEAGETLPVPRHCGLGRWDRIPQSATVRSVFADSRFHVSRGPRKFLCAELSGLWGLVRHNSPLSLAHATEFDFSRYRCAGLIGEPALTCLCSGRTGGQGERQFEFQRAGCGPSEIRGHGCPLRAGAEGAYTPIDSCPNTSGSSGGGAGRDSASCTSA
jgi:hypothetical protein